MWLYCFEVLCLGMVLLMLSMALVRAIADLELFISVVKHTNVTAAVNGTVANGGAYGPYDFSSDLGNKFMFFGISAGVMISITILAHVFQWIKTRCQKRNAGGYETV